MMTIYESYITKMLVSIPLSPIPSMMPVFFKSATDLCTVLYDTPKRTAISDNKMSVWAFICSKTLVFTLFSFWTSFV